ncbi:MAG: hypothetical protein WDZ75_02065 [Candidatus Paceibacterota bacterium]
MENGKFLVKVDDNYHYMDESERYTSGSFATLEEAIEECKKIARSSLADMYKEGIEPGTLGAQWAMFGEDPFVYSEEIKFEKPPFSARSFIDEKLCKEIIEELKNRGKNEK